MTPAQFAPALLVPLIVWRVYLRVRRTIGRQPWQPRRLVGRAIFFGVISGLYALAVMTNPTRLAALAGGMLLGVPLAWWGLHLTEYEETPEGKFYTPNLWIGLTLTLLFVGRLAYRLGTTSLAGFQWPTTGGPMPGGSSPALFSSPLTVAIFGLTAGYYMAYNLDVVRRGRKLLG
jgi:hypothetical protein